VKRFPWFLGNIWKKWISVLFLEAVLCRIAASALASALSDDCCCARIGMRYLMIVCLLITALPLGMWAQSPRAYVSKKVLTTDEKLNLFVEIASAPLPQDPAFPEIWGMKKGELSSRRNGPKTIYTQSYEPQRVGIFELPPVGIDMGNRTEYTLPITIRVERGEKPLRQLAVALNPENVPAFLQLEVSDSSIYVGQQTKVALYCWVPANMRNRFRWREEELNELETRLDQPDIWVESPKPLPTTPEEVERKGEKYLRFLIYRGFWFPKEVGRFKFGGGELWVEQQILGGYGNKKAQFLTVALPVPERQITARELPETMLPRAQSVGQFTFTYALTKSSFLTGETIPLTLRVRGDGNLSMVPRPFFQGHEKFLQYDPAISYSVLIEEGRLIGEKDFVFDMVPAFEGTYELGPAKMYYFQLETGRYDSLTIPAISVTIKGEDIPQLMEVDALDNFYREAMSQASEEPPASLPHRHLIAWLALVLGSLLILWQGFRLWKPGKQS
jgi:hypothetical protein